MIQISIIVPHRDAPQSVVDAVPRLTAVLARMVRPYELIVVDDGSTASALGVLRELLAREPHVRLLRLDWPNGRGAALGAAVAAARGEAIVAFDPRCGYVAEDVPRLVERLARADVVFGCRRAGFVGRLVREVVNLPRRLLGAPLVRDAHGTLWAARREAVEGLDLARGRDRRLPRLVAAAGYRVGELHVARNARGLRTAIAALGMAWRDLGRGRLIAWLRPAPQPAPVREIVATASVPPSDRQWRIDPGSRESSDGVLRPHTELGDHRTQPRYDQQN